MDQTRLEKLQKVESALTDMFSKKQIDEGVFYKGMVALALEYALEGEYEHAGVLVGRCSSEYVTEVMPQQMMSDESFGSLAYRLARLLADNGIASVEDYLKIKPGQA